VRRISAKRSIAIALTVVLATLWGVASARPAAGPARTPAVGATAGTPAVGPAFVGVDVDGPMLDPSSGLDLSHEFTTMVANGIGTVRVAFNWAAAQPYQSWTDVPIADRSQFTQTGRVPTSFTQTDRLVGLAAQHGMTVLPTVLYAPRWDAIRQRHRLAFPAVTAPFAGYLTALIGRYGPQGSYWSANPGVPRTPIRAWQIWNEENLSRYWRQPFVSGYVALLRAAHRAIKRADPGAKVVLGALTNSAWIPLRQIYEVRGARHLFDLASVNAFTKQPANVIRYLRLVRGVMDHFNDHKKPLLATEVSWPSAQGKTTVHFDWDTTEAGQARNISRVLPMLSADRRRLGLNGFYYYTWIGREWPGAPDFNFAGLERLTRSGAVSPKPALTAFGRAALALEHCRRRSSDARRCAQPTR
jgi:hypothetical protein